MYKIQFNECELNKFNTIENEKIRKSTMSVYSYFIKLIQESEGKLCISYRKFLKKFNVYHGSMTHQTLKTRVDILVNELGLLKVCKDDKKNFTYELDNKLDNKLDNELDNENSPEDVDNTSFEDDNNSDKDRILKDIDDNIYKNTNSSNKQKNYGEVFSDETEAVEVAKKILNELQIKSKWVINSTIGTVKRCYFNINKLGSFMYISKLILKLQAISKSVYKNTNVYSEAVKKYRAENTKKNLRFNDFPQREQDPTLENRLLEASESHCNDNSDIEDLLAKCKENGGLPL